MNPSEALFGRKVARLPDRGTLLVATDLQGNWGDYCAMKALYAEEEAAGREPVLLFCGDMVHGPSIELNRPGAWPSYLGTAYRDESAAILRDFMVFSKEARAFSLLGNHEHAHVGGPVVAKFYPDEAAVLRATLGADRAAAEAFMSTWPLIAVAGCGLAFVHGSPAATMPSLEDWESVDLTGYDGRTPFEMLRQNEAFSTVLWARSATEREAQSFLTTALPTLGGEGVVVFGHDVVRSGYAKVGGRQLCLSTSYGLHTEDKMYLRVNLASDYRSVDDLREGVELLRLYSASPATGSSPSAKCTDSMDLRVSRPSGPSTITSSPSVVMV